MLEVGKPVLQRNGAHEITRKFAGKGRRQRSSQDTRAFSRRFEGVRHELLYHQYDRGVSTNLSVEGMERDRGQIGEAADVEQVEKKVLDEDELLRASGGTGRAGKGALAIDLERESAVER